ncbi:hypothetical protein FRX31_031746 [Thalictrum thalictroides]|uniref:F-box domain-containing protein n=1 Tax=Thalictrum thalictroides TaxID=46969 RepID=A0A7J6V1I1_THATH|nr:hypothetical protein FRX31_031746 [Thalictrum thalictroides]
MMEKGYQEKETDIEKRKRGSRFIPCLNKLPQEIVLDIFSRLPVESLLQCKRVSRSWNTLISDPEFIKVHLLRASSSLVQQYPDILVFSKSKKLFRLSHESIKSLSLPKDFSSFFVNSCNGLLAFPKYDHEHHKLFVDIWNPYTLKRTRCPSVVDIPLYNSSPPWNFAACGFGYDPILNEYKVVALLRKPLANFEAVVCTIGSTSWRHIEEVPFKTFRKMKFNAVHLNGTFYWYTRSTKSILGVGSFRIRDEKFGFVACPSLSSCYNIFGEGEKVDLSVLGGDLCLVDYASHDNIVVWALKKHSGGDEVWTKQYVLTIPEHMYSMQLLYASDNGEILLILGNYMADNKFVYYDSKENRYRDDETLTALLSSEKYPSTFVHIGSLVSPPLPR